MSGNRKKTLAVLESLRRARLDSAEARSGEVTPWRHPARPDSRYRHVLEQTRAILAEIEGPSVVTDVSDTITEISGFSREEYIEGSPFFGIHEDDIEELTKLIANMGGGPPACAVFRVPHKEGHWIWLESGSLRPFRAIDGTMHTIVFARDVTETKRAEAALRESETRYRVVSEMSHDLISEVNEEHRLVHANSKTPDITGFSVEELLAIPPFTLVHPEDLDRVRSAYEGAVARGESTHIGPYRLRHRDGSFIWLETRGMFYERTGGTRRFLSLSRDVTEARRAEGERRDLEERMQQMQKLESLGVMAGGIAHDFNNLLTPILGAAGLALMDLPEDSPVRVRLLKIQRAAQRTAALTNQLLAYAGSESLEVQPVDLSTLVMEMHPLLESASSGKTTICYELQPRLPSVDADFSQLSQVLMNLATNATEAVGDGQGLITVRTGITEIEASTSSVYRVGDICPGPFVFIEVEDTGRGMDSATRSRVFDPFFTTKFTGRGLGLAAALGIVKSHRGAIEIDSVPGRGTRFRILLPNPTRRARHVPCTPP